MSTSETGSFLGSNAPWPPATITVRERSSPRSVCRTTQSSSHEIRSAVVSRWPGPSQTHFSGYRVVSWPPSSGSESMMRADASRMPAQKAADRPTGPAPITGMSRTCSRSWSWVVVMGSGEGLKGRDGLAVEGAERALQRDAQAGEAGSVAQRVGRRLRGAQALHEIEERAGVVRVEGDDELLVVQAERVGRVVVDLRVLAADGDVALHDPVALVGRDRVPGARLDERIDEQVPAAERARDQPLVLRVLRALADAQERVGLRGPLHEAALPEDDVQLVDAIEVLGLGHEHQVGVAARADQGEALQQVVGPEVLAGGEELLLVDQALVGVQAPPGGLDLQERVLDEVALVHPDRRIEGCVAPQTSA